MIVGSGVGVSVGVAENVVQAARNKTINGIVRRIFILKAYQVIFLDSI